MSLPSFLKNTFLVIILNTIIAFSGQFNLLLYTEAEGYHHQSITDGVQAIKKLSRKHNFDIKWTENSSIFADTSLNNYDVVVFLNTDGDILTAEQQQGLKNYYQKGKGFVGIHGAAATELEWDWFGKLVGRKFQTHPKIQTAKLTINENDFPATYHLPKQMLWTDEWYKFGPELSDNLNYLITVDESTYNPIEGGEDKGMGDFHPLVWYHKFEGGRSFYTALGHIGEAYKDPSFLEHIYGGIHWAVNDE